MSNKINSNNPKSITPLNKGKINLPAIFYKKSYNKSKLIPLNDTTNTLGFTRHYPAATKEWLNSIYAYNKNSVKSLPLADKTLSSLLTSYLNLYFKKNILQFKSVPIKYIRRSLDKIFVGKAELKHTSDKVIVTLYIYNEERRNLTTTIINLQSMLFKSYKLSDYYKKVKKCDDVSFPSYLEKLLGLLGDNNKIDAALNLNIIKTELEEEIKTLAQYKLLLNLNRSKFENTLLKKLSILVGKIYHKEVEFNIINLKTLQLDTNIFTQVILAKLGDKDNNILKVLNSSLSSVRLPDTNLIQERYSKIKCDFSWINKVKNLKINPTLMKDSVSTARKKDMLSQLFTDVFSTPQKAVIPTNLMEITNNSNNKDLDNIENIVFNSLKYINTGGVRLELKGRLTKKYTASRSVLKVKWKGSLKNVDSTYKGLSSVMVRGHVKSNLQHTAINSGNRYGSYGLKGWISNK